LNLDGALSRTYTIVFRGLSYTVILDDKI